MRPYVIGVDAGGTKTSACAFDLEGELLCQNVTGPGNFFEDPEGAWNHVVEAVDACKEQTGGMCVYIAVGASGICGAGLEEKTGLSLKERYGCQAIAVDDGRMALQAKLEGRDGVLVIAGTGSVAYGKAGQKTVRAGGWGMLLDDRGSAASIALESFRRLVRNQDEGFELTAMEEAILQGLNCPSVKQLPGALNRVSKTQLASLALTVIQFADQGDVGARQVLEEAGCQLAQMAFSAADRLGLKSPCTAVSGSVLEKCTWVSQAFFKEWNKRYKTASLAEKVERVEKGALWFYREQEKNDRAD